MKSGTRSRSRVLGVVRLGIVMTTFALTAVACGSDDDAPACDCHEPEVQCGDVCVDVTSSVENCGACDNACGDGESCVDSMCCAAGSAVCDGSCVDISTDPDNCGACGDVCTDGRVCDAGACVGSCSDGTTECDSSCVDTDTDPENCGDCGTACDDGEVCSDGECGLGCSGGTVLCGSSCVDTDVDPANCGACGEACDDGEVCSEGVCAVGCAGGTTECGGSCVDTSVDPSNCGACAEVCEAGQVCDAGSCALECSGGTTECDGGCVNTNTDTANCGACGEACEAEEVCNAGSCTFGCTGGTTDCSGSCVDTAVDPANCGACGEACEAEEVCNAGSCEFGCTGGATDCSGSCVDLDVDPANCGACGEACEAEEVCNAGSCEFSCTGGATDCSGSCVDTDVDPANCGACGEACEAEEVCNAGSCEFSCTGGATDCSGSCVDTDVDPANCGACGEACEAEEVCNAGSCEFECVGGTTECNGGCVDTDIDAANCGTCDNVCPDDEVCTAGVCGLECVGGTTECGDACVDTDVDPANCGTCDNVCNSIEACIDGTCEPQCPVDTTACDDVCADTEVDPSNCGGCGTVCDTSEACVAGLCEPVTLEYTSITPSTGYYPGGVLAAIVGAGFNAATTVTVGGTACTSLFLISASELRCEIPAAEAAADADVVVTRGGDQVTGTDAFSYVGFTQVTTLAGTGTAGDTDSTGDLSEFSTSVNGFELIGTTLYVADGVNHKIRTLDLTNFDPSDVQASDVVVDTLAGSGVLGTADSTDGTGATAEFQQPDDVSYTSGNTLYVSDVDWVTTPALGSTIRQVDRATGATTTVLTGGESFSALTDASPFVYVADCNDNTIRRWEIGTSNLVTLAGTSGVYGDVDDVGTAALLNCPYGVELNRTGTALYFSDWGNYKIKSLDLASQTVTTIAGTGAFGGTNGDALGVARFRYPNKLSLATRHLFVADMDTCAIRVVDLVASTVATVHGGQNRCTGSDGAVGTAAIGSPVAVFYSPYYGIFVGSGDWGWASAYFTTRQSVQLIH